MKRLLFIFCMILAVFTGTAVYGAEAETLSMAEETLITAIKNLETEVDIEEYELTPDKFKKLFSSTAAEVDYKYCLCSNSSYTVNNSGYVEKINLNYIYYSDEEKAEIEKAVEGILALTSNQTNLQKVETVYNYFCSNCNYVPDYEHNNIYGALVENKSACFGLSQAFKLIMDRLNIPCKICISPNADHAWNKVYVNDEWYNIDLAKAGVNSNRLFLMNDLYAAINGIPVFDE